MPAFMFLRIYQDFRKSSSMKSVRAVAIMFVSVAWHHSAKHLHKCAQLLRFSISLKFKNLHWMSQWGCISYTWLSWSVLNRPQGIQFRIKKAVLDPFLRSAPHSRTFDHMCTTITLLDELELQKYLNACLRKVVTNTFKRFLNLRCPTVSFHSTPFAKSCACHVIIRFRAPCSEVASTSGRFNLKEIFL